MANNGVCAVDLETHRRAAIFLGQAYERWPPVRRGAAGRWLMVRDRALVCHTATSSRRARRVGCYSPHPSILTCNPPVDITGAIPWRENTGQGTAGVPVKIKSIGLFHWLEVARNRGILI